MKTFALAVLLVLQTPGPVRIQTAAISGRVEFSVGHPATSVGVFAIQANPGAAAEKAIVTARAETDNAGNYQLKDLPNGSYYIASGLLESLTYFPGVTKLTAARAVVISGGNARAAVDFTLDSTTLDTLTEVREVPPDAGAIRSTGKAVKATTKLELRQVLQVESEKEWWAARVIELLQDGRVKIHYLGWDASFDEVVTRSRLQLDDKAIEQTHLPAVSSGTRRTEVSSNPESTEKGLVPANAGPIESTGRTVTATTKLKRNQVLQVESGKTWWAARVLELLQDGRVKIHYLGWSAGSDEAVTRSRLQLDDNAIEKTRQRTTSSTLRAEASSKPEMTEKGKVPKDAGPIESTGKTVTDSTKLDRNQVLQVESGKLWWAARVLDLLQDGRVKIHYLGWDAGFDEVVPRSRLQLDDKAIEKTQQLQGVDTVGIGR